MLGSQTQKLLMINLKEMENIFTKMVKVIQGNLKMIKKMVEVNIIIKMAIYAMMETLLMIALKEMENTIMKKVNIISENSKTFKKW